MRTTLAILLAFACLVWAPRESWAFDADGADTVFLLAVGYGRASYERTGEASDFSVDEPGFAADLELGLALGERTVGTVSYRALWYGNPNSPVGPGIYRNALAGIGLRHFLRPASPRLVLSGTVGLASSNHANPSSGGFGFAVGVGYEVVRGVIAELSYLGADVGEERSMSNLTLTVGWLVY